MISERQGPTRSEQTNTIVALCQGAIEGKVTDEIVRTALDAREQALDEARTGFAEGAAEEKLSNPAAEQWQVYVDALLWSFDEYKKALIELRATLRAKDEAFAAAVMSLIEANERLFVATEAYEMRLVTAGKSRFAMHNYLVNMTHAVRAGDLSKEGYADILARTRRYYDDCMNEMSKAPEGEPLEAVAKMQAAFGQCRDALYEMERWFADGDAAHLDNGLDWHEKGQADADEGFTMHRQEKYAAGPTSSPVANTFIAAAELVKRGQYPIETFQENIENLAVHLQNVRSGFESVCQASTSSAAIQEEIPKAMEAFDLHEEAIEAYRRFAESLNPADVEEGNAKLIDAIRRLDEAKVTFEAVAEREGKTVCPRCGALNDPSHRVCGKCNAALPHMATDGASSSFAIAEGGEVDTGGSDVVLTEHMRRVIEDTNRVAAGEIGAAEYRETLNWMRGLIAEGERELSVTPHLVPEQFPEEERERAQSEKVLVEDTRNMLGEAMQGVRDSLDELEAFLKDGNQQHLMDGLRAFWNASQQLYQVQRIGELAARSAEDEEAVVPSTDDLVEAPPPERI